MSTVQSSDDRAVCLMLQTTVTLSVAVGQAIFYRDMEFAWYRDVVQPARTARSAGLDGLKKFHRRLSLIADGWESRAAELSGKCAPCGHCGALTPDRDDAVCLSCGYDTESSIYPCRKCGGSGVAYGYRAENCEECYSTGKLDNPFIDYRIHYLDGIGDDLVSARFAIPSLPPSTQAILSQVAHRETVGKRETFAYLDDGSKVSLKIVLLPLSIAEREEYT